jgi:alpha-glucosidase
LNRVQLSILSLLLLTGLAAGCNDSNSLQDTGGGTFIAGPPGEKGETGEKGPAGEKGENGPAGDSGGGVADVIALASGAITPRSGGFDVQLKNDVLEVRAAAANALRLHYMQEGESDQLTQVVDPDLKFDAAFQLIPDPAGKGMALKTEAFTASWDGPLQRLIVTNVDGQQLMAVRASDLRRGRVVVQHNPVDTLYGINGSGRLLRDYNSDQYDEESAAGLIRDQQEGLEAGAHGHAGAPLVWSTAGYGVLVDTMGSITRAIDLRTKGSIAFATVSKDDPDAYLIVGNPKEVFGAVAKISGRTPLFPRWAMGFMNSAWGADNLWSGTDNSVGMTEAKLKNIIEGYRGVYPIGSPVPLEVRASAGTPPTRIPLDAFIFDLDWMNWARNDLPYSQFTWNTAKFPSAMTDSTATQPNLKDWLNGRGVTMAGILKPRLPVSSAEGAEIGRLGFWMHNAPTVPDYFRPETQMRHFDFSNPDARKWYFDRLKGAFDAGIAGWWNDEADSSRGPDGDNETEGTDMQRAVYEGQRGHSNQRVFSINRNFYLGAQRYAYGLWSGDINNGFDSMAIQRQRMLSSINAGAMQWTMDTGGFFNSNGLGADEGTGNEDYARWMQFSIFTPIFRVHATNGNQRQPWFYVPPGQRLGDTAAVEAIRLRYRLIPYIYSYEHQRRKSGVGIVRPLIFDWPQDQNVRNTIDSWLFGEWLLASPVVRPMRTELAEAQDTKDIYLPSGTWTRWNSGMIEEGGRTTRFATRPWERNFPLFIRQGAIIPMMSDADANPASQTYVTSVGRWHPTELDVAVYPDTKRTSFDYYDDDGTTYDYEKGVYFLQNLSVQRKSNEVTFETAVPEGTFKPALKYYTLRIYGQNATTVSVNGERLNRGTNSAELTGETVGWVNEIDTARNNLQVTYVRIKAQEKQSVVLTTP